VQAVIKITLEASR